MGYYRLYRLSGPAGRFVGFEEIEAPDDAAALEIANGHVGALPLELWCGSRRIASIAASSSSQALSAGGQRQ